MKNTHTCTSLTSQASLSSDRLGLTDCVIVVFSKFTLFKADKYIMDALVHLRKKTGAGGQGGVTTGEPVKLWYIDCTESGENHSS